ncbi:MAG: hypothetical protein FWF26_01485, partial [Treponema sp.]|nr:hypothetical protein [Treponema sp.]
MNKKLLSFSFFKIIAILAIALLAFASCGAVGDQTSPSITGGNTNGDGNNDSVTPPPSTSLGIGDYIVILNKLISDGKLDISDLYPSGENPPVNSSIDVYDDSDNFLFTLKLNDDGNVEMVLPGDSNSYVLDKDGDGYALESTNPGTTDPGTTDPGTGDQEGTGGQEPGDVTPPTPIDPADALAKIFSDNGFNGVTFDSVPEGLINEEDGTLNTAMLPIVVTGKDKNDYSITNDNGTIKIIKVAPPAPIVPADELAKIFSDNGFSVTFDPTSVPDGLINKDDGTLNTTMLPVVVTGKDGNKYKITNDTGTIKIVKVIPIVPADELAKIFSDNGFSVTFDPNSVPEGLINKEDGTLNTSMLPVVVTGL